MGTFHRTSRRAFIAGCLACTVAGAAASEESRVATIAVASNFLAVAELLAARVTAETTHEIRIVHGATGRLTAQVLRGAPFDIVLAADAERPRALLDAGVAEAGPRAYANGRLALISSKGPVPSTWEAAVEAIASANRVAIAEPRLAPYGAAAAVVLDRVSHTGTRVFGESVAQAYAFVASGNAPLGFVGLAQAMEAGRPALSVPPALYPPIRQDAVLLIRGAGNPAALAFWNLLFSDEGRALIAASGYEVPA